jgi:hypothetical protein
MFSLVDTTVSGGTILLKDYQKKKQKKEQKSENMINAKLNKKNNTTIKPKKIENKKENNIIKAKVIRINPTLKQKKIINDWIAATRKVWNSCLHYINKNRTEKYTCNSIRDKFITEKQMCPKTKKEMKWTLRTPKRIREYAVKDLFACIQSTTKQYRRNKYLYKIKKLKKKPRKPKINPKNKNSKTQTISLPKESSYIINKKKIINGIEEEYTILRVCSEDIILTEKLDVKNIDSNMRLTRVGFSYFISIPVKTCLTEQKESKDNICSIDPGENIPWSYYDPSGEYGFIGIGLKEKIYSIYDKIKSLKLHLNHRKNKAIKKQELKIFNIVNDLQWKVCHLLLEKYNKILIPRLYVRSCSKIRRELQADMRHCTFVNRLIY